MDKMDNLKPKPKTKSEDGMETKPKATKPPKEKPASKKPIKDELEEDIDFVKISAEVLIEKFDTRKKQIDADIKTPDDEELFAEDDIDDEEVTLETSLIPTDTSDRIILVVDEESTRRSETVTIIRQILPNAEIEEADDPEEAQEMMDEVDFDTYVVNFLMPGFSSSPFVKSVINHPDHPLLIGFAADKMSDAVDPKKGLKIIPLKRLFDLDVAAAGEGEEAAGEPADDDLD